MVEELRVLLKYVAFVGLAPATSKPRQQLAQQILTLLIALLYLIGAVYAIIVLPPNRSIVSSLVSILLYATTLCTWTVIVLETLMTYRKHLNFYEKSQHIRQLFSRQLQMFVCQRNLRRQQIGKLIFYGIFIYGFYIIRVLTVRHRRCTSFLLLPALLIIRLRCLQIILYMDYIIHYMSMLNLKLQALVTYKCNNQCLALCLDVNYERLKTLEYLLALKRIYNEIYEFCLLFNDFFGWSLVFLSGLIFFSIIVNAYWAFHIVIAVDRFHILVSSILTIAPKTLMFCMICSSGEHLLLEYRKSIGFVQRLIGDAKSVQKTKDYADLAGEFALQLMQNKIEINGKQFFIFNMKLLMELFVALITYLVILLQFCTDEVDDTDDND